MISQLFREPLLHFLLLGGFIYWAFEASSNDSTDTILVDKKNLLTFMQYRYQAFDPQQADKTFNNLPPEKLQALIKEYTQEEALYRQALSLNLDKNDYIIKKRLIQKMEYIAEDFNLPDNADNPDNEQTLIAYFNGHQQDYVQPDYITFTHQFFSNDSKTTSLSAQQRALQALDQLNNGDSGSKAIKQDLFMYNRHYAERPQSLVASHFGDPFAQQLFTQTTVNEALWQGPFESPHGWHIVKVFKRQPEKYPEFAEIKAQVKEDYLREQLRQQKQQSIEKIVDQYQTKVEL
ncbi:peptidylprolyl isomerase [Thalassotalea litorea]|uniref:peptidylprolyl isomerase n=1 Tax=Thalassotalea litorea TaxID=2020715 RepID=UPI003736D6BE